MDRIEFIKQLRIALSGVVNHIVIEDNVRYYEDYIDMEMRKGKTEEQVLSELGNPRLIAKTIIETNKAAGSETEEYSENSTYENNAESRQSARGNSGVHVFGLPLWLVGVLTVILLFMLFTLVTTTLFALLPYLLPIILIFVVIRIIRRMME